MVRAHGCVLAIVVVLTASSCGARVDPYVGQEAAGPPPAADGRALIGGADAPDRGEELSVGGAAAGSPAGVAATSGAAGVAEVSEAGSAGGATAAPSYSFDPADQAAACPPSAENTASDVGVKPDSIILGNVSGLTGVLPDSFEPGPRAVQALFSAINDHGGICGRELKLIVEDDGQDASKNAAAVADLAPRVLAFVGSTSSADNGGVQEMVQAGAPDLGFGINASRSQSPVYYSAGGSTLTFRDGRHWYYNTVQQGQKRFGPRPTRLAVLAYNIPISSDAAKQFAYVWEHEGTEICFTDFSISPATASLDQDVIQMKEADCDGVYTTLDITGNAKLLQAMKRQRFDPVFKGTTFAGYSDSQIEVAGVEAAEGFESTIPFVPFDDPNPVMRRFVEQLAIYQPGTEPTSFGLQAWGSAQLLVYALIKSGPNPTRAKLIEVLESVSDWDTGGAMSVTTPRERLPSGPCNTEMIVRNGRWVRAWPAEALFCDAQLVPSSD